MMKSFELMMESGSSSSSSRQGFYQGEDHNNNPSSSSSRFGIISSQLPNSSTSASASNPPPSFEHQLSSFPSSSSYYSHPPRGPTPEFMSYYSGGGGGGGAGFAPAPTSQLLPPPDHILMMSRPSTSTANASGNQEDSSDQVGPSGSGGGMMVVEREHMFDKVVTPSDVGKLNRLVIPKQHAEKYFPLDSSTNEKGLLLNFEDRNGKPWRFRYSYWNSSQSYVMTKGWSRFVKEKKLDAGDIVSFQRGLGCKDRLFIDWRRRPDYSAAVAPPSSLPPLPRLYHHHPSFNHSFTNPHHHQPQFAFHNYPTAWNHHHPYNYLQNNSFTNHFQHELGSSRAGNYGNPVIYLGRPPGGYSGSGSGSGSAQVIRAMTTIPRAEDDDDDDHDDEEEGGGGGQGGMVYESIPVVQGKATAKRLRLFGVNMDCPIPTSKEEGDQLDHQYAAASEILTIPLSSASRFSTSSSPLMIRPYIDSIDDNNVSSINNAVSQTMPNHSSSSSSAKGKASSSTSMSLDLDI